MSCPGPCVLCGSTNYPPSLGGPTICPSCDCGNFVDHALAVKRMMGLAPPPTHDERLAKAVADMAALERVLCPMCMNAPGLCPRHDPTIVAMQAKRFIEPGRLVTSDDVELLKR